MCVNFLSAWNKVIAWTCVATDSFKIGWRCTIFPVTAVRHISIHTHGDAGSNGLAQLEDRRALLVWNH